ncbi:MAG: hypothetical protein ACK5O7_02380 [Holosporales bacterium]
MNRILIGLAALSATQVFASDLREDESTTAQTMHVTSASVEEGFEADKPRTQDVIKDTLRQAETLIKEEAKVLEIKAKTQLVHANAHLEGMIDKAKDKKEKAKKKLKRALKKLK